jgi:flagellar protein FlaG
MLNLSHFTRQKVLPKVTQQVLYFHQKTEQEVTFGKAPAIVPPAANHQLSDTFCHVHRQQCTRVERAGPEVLPSPPQTQYTASMTLATQPNVKLLNDAGYRENYANSVQMRVNVWDFFLVFGTLQQQTETQVEIRNFQGIYLSPQQAKALLGLLQQNVAGYETAFGEIKLDPRMTPPGPVH